MQFHPIVLFRSRQNARTFALRMLLELNDVLVEGAENTVSMMVRDRQVSCLTGGTG